MATYITLIKFTEQGAKTIKELPARVDANKKRLRDLGCELKSYYLTMGQYDVVVTFEAPNDEAIAKFALMIGSQGNATTQTLRAFSEDETRKLIAALP